MSRQGHLTCATLSAPARLGASLEGCQVKSNQDLASKQSPQVCFWQFDNDHHNVRGNKRSAFFNTDYSWQPSGVREARATIEGNWPSTREVIAWLRMSRAMLRSHGRLVRRHF